MRVHRWFPLQVVRAVSLVLVALFVVLVRAGRTEDEAGTIHVFSGLSSESTAILELALTGVGSDLSLVVERVPPNLLSDRVQGNETSILFGYPVPLLLELYATTGSASTVPVDLEAGSCVPVTPGVAALWFDPLVIVWNGEYLEGRAPSTGWLPREYAELGHGSFADRLVLAEASASNATGVLVGALFDSNDGETLLEFLDANRMGSYLESTRGVLSDVITSSAGKLGVVTYRDYQMTIDGWLSGGIDVSDARTHFPSGIPAAELLGLAITGPAVNSIGELVEAIETPELTARIANLDYLVPTSELVSDDLLDPWVAPFRIALAGELERIIKQRLMSEDVVSTYQREIRGRLKRKEDVFTEIYDALWVVAMGVFFYWVFRRRNRPLRRRSDTTP